LTIARTLRFHHFYLFAHAQKRAEHIDTHHMFKIGVGLFVDLPDFAFDAGIVDGDIQARKTLPDLLEKRRHIGFARNVGLDEYRVRTALISKPRRGGSTGGLVTVRDDNGSTFLHELGSREPADALAGSGHENDLILKTLHLRLRLLSMGLAAMVDFFVSCSVRRRA
jgi:hypothetical protein